MCHDVSMQRTWVETISVIQKNRLSAVSIGRIADISESTVRNALKGRNEPSRITRRVISEAVDFLINHNVSGSVRQESVSLEPEALADLETAKAEHQLLTDMYLEDAPRTMAAALAARRAL
jgi:hypothetical protein